MANISSILRKIREAIYGQEVRGSLADGLEAVNNETIAATNLSKQTKERQDLLDSKFDEQIKNMTLQDPSSAEIVAMRTNLNGITHQTAGKRVDELESSLEDTTTKVKFLEELKLFLVYGAKGDGITDDSNAILNAINETPINGELYFPSGYTFGIGKKIVFPKTMYIKGNCILSKLPSFNDDFAIDVSADVTGFKTDNIEIKGNNMPGGGIVLRSRTNYIHFGNIKITKSMSHGLFLTNTWNSNFEHLYITESSGGGIFLNNDCSGNHFYGGIIRQNKGGNIVFNNNTIFDNTFIGMMIEYSFKDNSDLTSPNGCIQINGSRHNTFIGCEIANEPWNKLVNIVDCESIDFISCEFGRPNSNGGHRDVYTNIPANSDEVKAIVVNNGKVTLDNCKFVNTITKDLDILGTTARVSAINTSIKNITAYPKGTFSYINMEKNSADDNNYSSDDKLTIYAPALFLLNTPIVASGDIIQSSGSFFRIGSTRPTNPVGRESYWDPVLKKVLYFDGGTKKWLDAMGNVVL